MCVLECVMCMCTPCMQSPLELYFKPGLWLFGHQVVASAFFSTTLLPSLFIVFKLNASESLTPPPPCDKCPVSWALLCIKNVRGLSGLICFPLLIGKLRVIVNNLIGSKDCFCGGMWYDT